ncbi:hypothetical protein M8J77_004388 [Diaphorina citri]|nr:hypothetical protein M8J77_004388 [Diaphorina citri]
MQYADMFKKSSSSRVSYVPRSGYNKSPPPANSPKVESLYLPKTCGFSLPFDPTIPMDKYLCAIGDIVGDSKMVFAGKNNDLVKIYLTSEAEVVKFYETNPQIVIDGKVLTVRKLINNGHKIFLCNTEPGMSDSMLINELTKYTKVVSDMKFVNLGSRNERFGHLIGFRRTVLVEDVEDLPASFNLYHENMTYKIFIVIDRVKCFNCNAEGHISKNCPVEKTSAQERLKINKDTQSDGSQAGDQRRDEPTCSFLPSFASRTPTTAIPPLMEVVVSSPAPAPVDAFSTPTISPESETPVGVSTDVTEPCDVSGASMETEAFIEMSSQEMKKNLNDNNTVETDKGKKRSLAQSPPPQDCEKKVCVQANDLEPICPLIEKHEPSVDPHVFIDLIHELKGTPNKRKLDIINDNYDMSPQSVVEVLEKIVTEQSEIKIKNRMKNLCKTISNLMKEHNSNTSPPSADPNENMDLSQSDN